MGSVATNGTKSETSIPPPEVISIDSPPTVAPSESPKGGNSVLDVAAAAATTAAVGVTNVMGKTINEVQQAIENIQKDDEDDQDSLGIGSGTRAKLAEQAKRTNEQREKQRISAGVAGLVYSDESDDEGEDESPTRGLTTSNGNGNGAIPTLAATAIPLPTSPPPFSAGGGPRISPAPTPGLAERLEPALSLPNTPPLDRNATIPPKPPSSWTVDDVVNWSIAKGFDDSICQKFRGEPTSMSEKNSQLTPSEHEITGDLLLELDANLLKELDIPAFGKRLRIAQAISELRRPSSNSSSVNPLSPRGLEASSQNSFRGMSAPPSAMIPPATTPPLTSTPPDEGYSAWTHSRKASANQPAMEAIREGAPSFSVAPSTATAAPSFSTAPSTATGNPPSTTATSVPASPVTPNSTTAKRESSGSLGHKKKGSLDNRERLSFFGRNRKPAP